MRRLLILLAFPLIAADTVHAQSDPAGFQAPSGNISCLVFIESPQNSIRCDIKVMDTRPKRPADCDLEYGRAFQMNSKGRAERICYGDTLTDKPLAVVPYGEVWQRGGFSCKSEPTGVTCRNGEGHGFSLSRPKQEIF
jgi:hypothetical protein